MNTSKQFTPCCQDYCEYVGEDTGGIQHYWCPNCGAHHEGARVGYPTETWTTHYPKGIVRRIQE